MVQRMYNKGLIQTWHNMFDSNMVFLVRIYSFIEMYCSISLSGIRFSTSKRLFLNLNVEKVNRRSRKRRFMRERKSCREYREIPFQLKDTKKMLCFHISTLLILWHGFIPFNGMSFQGVFFLKIQLALNYTISQLIMSV